MSALDHFNLNLDADPYWSESSWFSWAIPDRDINGFFYNHFRPNMNCMLAGPAMWDGSGEHVWEFRYFDWQLMRLLPDGRYGVDYDKYDFATPWGMSIRTLEPGMSYRLGYERHEFKLDLEFEGLTAPHVLSPAAPPGSDQPSRLHFEQPGRIRGTVGLDGETFAVDCHSIRDGSHGRRHLETPTPGGYSWSTADAKTGFHVLAIDRRRGHDTEVIGGYLLRDGEIAHIEKGVRRVVERTGPRPSRIEVIAEDVLGRELHALGREQTPAEIMLFPDHGQWWTLFRWDFDGFTDAVGEDQEYYGIQDFRRWHRAGPEAWKSR
jgi:hypothetical protein